MSVREKSNACDIGQIIYQALFRTHSVFHTSMSCSKWLTMFTSSTISSPLMRCDGASKDKEKSLDTLNCE